MTINLLQAFVSLLFLAISLHFTVRCDKYPLLNNIPETNFSCWRRSPGYYADPSEQSRCQVYHMCQSSGRVFSYLCPNHTLFDQDRLICDHWFKVNCSNIENRYKVNDQIFLESVAKTPKRRANNVARGLAPPLPRRNAKPPSGSVIANVTSISSTSAVTRRRGLTLTTVVATVSRAPFDQKDVTLTTRPRPGGAARRKLIFASPDDVIVPPKLDATLTPRRIDIDDVGKAIVKDLDLVKDLDRFEPVKIGGRNSIVESGGKVCPGCLEYFMKDKVTCTPCVVPR